MKRLVAATCVAVSLVCGSASVVSAAPGVVSIRHNRVTHTPHRGVRPIGMLRTVLPSSGVQPTTVQDWHTELRLSGRSVIVAVVDTGVDPTADRMRDRLVVGADFTGEGSWRDGNGHGTHVAGIVAKVNPFVKIMPVKVLNRDGDGSMLAVAQGVAWAVDNGAEIVNLSIGAPIGTEDGEEALRDALRDARSRGVLVVAAAGNDGEYGSMPVVPAAWEEALAVAAVSGNDVAPYSNRGRYVDIAAEGTDVYSAGLGGGDVAMSGTSMAAPAVAGAASVLLALRPGWSGIDAGNQLRATAIDIDRPGPDQGSGYGIMDIAAALGCPGPSVPTGTMPEGTPSDIRLRKRVGGVDITTPDAEVVFVEVNGEITLVERSASFFVVPEPTGVLVWYYDAEGAPTRPVGILLTPRKPPRLQASVRRRSDGVRLTIDPRVEKGSMLSVSTFVGRKKTEDAAILEAGVQMLSFANRKITAVEICYAVESLRLGCRTFRRT